MRVIRITGFRYEDISVANVLYVEHEHERKTVLQFTSGISTIEFIPHAHLVLCSSSVRLKLFLTPSGLILTP